MTHYARLIRPILTKRFRRFRGHIMLLRPSHWIKSLIAVAIGPILMIGEATPSRLLILAGTIAMFSLASSAVYVINDLSDIEYDKLHATKRKRPLASGAVTPRAAHWILAGLVTTLTLMATILPALLSTIVAIYVCSNLIYSFWLKHVPIVEMLFVTIGFVLRAISGYVAFEVMPDPWVIATVLAGSLLLTIGKRREELRLKTESSNHRPVLAHYSEQLLDAYLLAAAIASLGVFFAAMIRVFDSANLNALFFLSLPFAIYLFKRYLLLAYMGSKTSNPTKLILSDRPLRFVIIFWALTLGIAAELINIEAFDGLFVLVTKP